jgi:hypothetical protein
MSDLKLSQEIASRTAEILKLEERLQALQIPAAAPVADGFDSATEFMQAMREHHASERDRLDELQAVEAILPSAKAKLQELRDRFDGIKSPVEKHFEELTAAALEANKIFEQADIAYNKVLEMANHQAALGHLTVFGTQPLHQNAAYSNIVFAVSSSQISVMGRRQFLDYQKSGNVSEGTQI